MSLSYDPHWPWKRPDLNFDLTKRPWWLFRPHREQRTTLEHHALKYVPEDKDLNCFEGLDWRKRQLLMARLRRLESEVNLKPLPAATALVAVVVGVIGLNLASAKGTNLYDAAQSGVTILVLFGAVILLAEIKRHTRKEACLTAWIEAFKDSHSLKTKEEEEARKLNEMRAHEPEKNTVDNFAL